MTGLPAGAPDVREVLRVVRDALDAEVLPATTDRVQYVVRMSCRLLDVIGAELDAGTAVPRQLDAALAAIGAASEAALAAGLLDGTIDADDRAVRALIDEAVRWRVAIARPRTACRGAAAAMSNPRGSPRRTGRPVAADSAATRQAILDAATAAFGAHGYEGTSIQIIAQQADLTPATLYHYFPGKAAIFQTVGDEVTVEFRRRTDAATEGIDSARLCVAAVLRTLGDWVLERPEIASFIATYAAEVGRNREVRRLSPRARWTEPMEYYAAFARHGLANGEIADDVDVEQFAGLVQGLIYGLSALVGVGRAFGPPEQLVDVFVRAVEGTVFVAPR